MTTQGSRTPEEIQVEIEHQREQLAGTLDALSAKLDVKTQAQAKIAEVRTQVKDRATTEAGRPRAEMILLGAAVVVAVALVWWRRR